MVRRFFLLCFGFLLLQSCGAPGGGTHGAVRVGIDFTWYPVDFGDLQPYVNGFMEELLLEIAKDSGLEFERIPANWDSVTAGLEGRQYEAILSSLPLYDFNQARYDFSNTVLTLGPVLAVLQQSADVNLGQMQGRRVGVVLGDPAEVMLQRQEGVLAREYSSIPSLLTAVVDREIDAALLSRLPAVRYVNDLFAGKLKIATLPLDESGIRLVVLKGKNPRLIGQFNKSFEYLKKKNKLQKLMQKWQLG
ncbi:MAG: transporter substrate-binding domain-containing protein [Chlamydiia bacterium]|nr:transporter substrate-binding domain-containing protein [Chlamydiia bacterium]